jgi:hypothetical protein
MVYDSITLRKLAQIDLLRRRHRCLQGNKFKKQPKINGHYRQEAIKSHERNTKINKPDKEKRGKRTNARARNGNLRERRKRGKKGGDGE